MCRNQTHFSFQCFILSSLLKGMFRDIWVVLPIYAVNLGVVGVALLEDCKGVVGGGDLPLLVPDPPPPALPSCPQPLQHHPSTCSDSTVQVHVQRGEALPWCHQKLLQHPSLPSRELLLLRRAYLDCGRGERRARAPPKRERSLERTCNPTAQDHPDAMGYMNSPGTPMQEEPRGYQGQQMVLVFFGPPRNAYWGTICTPVNVFLGEPGCKLNQEGSKWNPGCIYFQGGTKGNAVPQ